MKHLLVGTVLLSAAWSAADADVFGSGTNVFTIDFATVADAGNAPGASGYGSVPYDYRLSTHEISQDMVTRAVANGMTGVSAGAWSGDQPAAFIDWFEAAAFVNFLNTGLGLAPVYNLAWNGETWSMSLWSTSQAWQAGGENRYRHKDAYYFLPSEDEWFKAAYYKGGGTNADYWTYPTAQNDAPVAVASGTTDYTAVYGEQDQPAGVAVSGGRSAYGHRGMGGNVAEWTESAWDGLNNSTSEARTVRGGDWFGPDGELQSSWRDINAPLYESDFIGFRVASVPEPRAAALLLFAVLGAAIWRFLFPREG